MAGIYLHIPFCKKRCIYCDFYSTTNTNFVETYLETLIKELKLRRGEITEKIQSIYFGGGTPSQLSPQQITRVIRQIYKLYDVEDHAEITVEANPDDITESWIEGIAESGVNRISLGIQTFHEKELHFLNRRHTGRQAVEAVRTCQTHGFQNISIDLIYGLPHQDLSDWKNNIIQALDLNIQHISAYALIYEENTPLWNMRQQNKISEADEESSLAMFETLIEQLTQAGFEHYEISNFAIPGFQSRHNSSYWLNQPYLGCGASAHSYNGNDQRRYNKPDLIQYIKGIKEWDQNGTHSLPFFEIEYLTKTDQYNDRIITSLRTCWGLNLNKLEHDFGRKLTDYCLKMATTHIKNQTLQIIPDKTDHLQRLLRLTPKGLFLSDGIMSDLLFVDDH